MQQPPSDLAPEDVLDVVRRAWRLDAVSASYLPVGFGSHHWRVEDDSGTAWFVTADDLSAPGAAEGLVAAFGVAVAADARGVPGVHAPLPAPGGRVVVRTGSWGVSLQPWLEGAAGRFADRWSDEDAVAVVRLLAALHAVDVPIARPEEGGLPGRAALEVALVQVRDGVPFSGGPLAAEVGRLLGGSLRRLRTTLDALDREPGPGPADLVVTHGEPHPGNVVRTPGGPVLVDWDTARLAEPERDLWLVAARSGVDVGALYEQLTGRTVDPARMVARRRRWLLLDVASFVPGLLAARAADADTAWQIDALAETLDAL